MYDLGNQRYYLLLDQHVIDGLLIEWSGADESDTEFMEANGYDPNKDYGVYQVEKELFNMPIHQWKGQAKFFENNPASSYAILDLSEDDYKLVRSGPASDMLSRNQILEYIEEDPIEETEEEIIRAGKEREEKEIQDIDKDPKKSGINKKIAISVASVVVLGLGFVFKKFL